MAIEKDEPPPRGGLRHAAENLHPGFPTRDGPVLHEFRHAYRSATIELALPAVAVIPNAPPQVSR